MTKAAKTCFRHSCFRLILYSLYIVCDLKGPGCGGAFWSIFFQLFSLNRFEVSLHTPSYFNASIDTHCCLFRIIIAEAENMLTSSRLLPLFSQNGFAAVRRGKLFLTPTANR